MKEVMLKQKDTVSLELFITTHKSELDNFAHFWQEQQEQNPKEWPNKLSLGDWEEQFLMWIAGAQPESK